MISRKNSHRSWIVIGHSTLSKELPNPVHNRAWNELFIRVQLDRGSHLSPSSPRYHTMAKSSVGNAVDGNTPFLRLHRSERIQQQVTKSHEYPQGYHFWRIPIRKSVKASVMFICDEKVFKGVRRPRRGQVNDASVLLVELSSPVWSLKR